MHLQVGARTGDIGYFDTNDELFVVERLKASTDPPFAVMQSHRAHTRK